MGSLVCVVLHLTTPLPLSLSMYVSPCVRIYSLWLECVQSEPSEFIVVIATASPQQNLHQSCVFFNKTTREVGSGPFLKRAVGCQANQMNRLTHPIAPTGPETGPLCEKREWNISELLLLWSMILTHSRLSISVSTLSYVLEQTFIVIIIKKSCLLQL